MDKVKIYGNILDDETRCSHYQSSLDVIAIKFKCCGRYYPCYQCHEEAAGHKAQVWEESEWDQTAILCGVCKTELTINEYMHSGNCCPKCNTGFNPKCSTHYHLYFQTR